MKILVVDDDPMAAEMTAAVLEESGHETVTAENGVEAMERLGEHPDVTLVISDMNMPLISGIDLFHTLREQGMTLPFILLTGDEPESLLQREPNVDACLLKDFTLQETLGRLVDEVVARATARS